MSSPVLVCGAAGFMGRKVCEMLTRRGIVPIGLGRGTLSAQDQQFLGLKAWHSADVALIPCTLFCKARSHLPSSIALVLVRLEPFTRLPMMPTSVR